MYANISISKVKWLWRYYCENYVIFKQLHVLYLLSMMQYLYTALVHPAHIKAKPYNGTCAIHGLTIKFANSLL